MAFGMTKAQQREHAMLCEQLSSAHGELTEAVEAFNAAVAEARGALEEAVTRYNEKLTETRDFIEGIREDADNELSEKSDKFRESEKGEVIAAWIEQLGEYVPDDVEIDFPEEIDLPDDDAVTQLGDLPSKPGDE